MDMLNSCGHALGQGDRSDFNPGWNWEATPSGYNTCMREKRRKVRAHTTGISGDHTVLGCFLLPCGLGSRRDLAGKKRGEGTLAGGP